MGGQCHAPAALPLGKSPVAIVQCVLVSSLNVDIEPEKLRPLRDTVAI